MKVKSQLLLPVLALAGCHHTPSPWDGQWTLDESKSNVTALSFTVAISPDGMYHLNDGAIEYSFRCDGKPYPTLSAGSISCTQTDPATLSLKETTNDPDSTTTRWALSADGKTLTATHRLIQIDNSTKDKQLVYARDVATSGFSGRWKATKPLDAQPKTIVLILNYDSFHFEDHEWGQFSDTRLEQPATPIRGANQPFGFSRSAKLLSPREIHTEDTFAGHVVLRTSWKVSDDGKTLYEESEIPTNPTQKNLLIYTKP